MTWQEIIRKKSCCSACAEKQKQQFEKTPATGGRKKLDKNKNGKIDAEDFKLLREGVKKEAVTTTSSPALFGESYSGRRVKRGKKEEE